MSRDGSIDLPFAGEHRHFRLDWASLMKLQEAVGAGPFLTLNKLLNGSWRVDDIAETIRCGLIGGGLAPNDAMTLVDQYVKTRPPLENLTIAQRVLGAGLAGAGEEEIVGKKSEADETDREMPHSRTESSGSPPSTETE